MEKLCRTCVALPEHFCDEVASGAPAGLAQVPYLARIFGQVDCPRSVAHVKKARCDEVSAYGPPQVTVGKNVAAPESLNPVVSVCPKEVDHTAIAPSSGSLFTENFPTIEDPPRVGVIMEVHLEHSIQSA